ncbi:hypothetical protein [Campylobacter ureolyticus]|uniref:Uncharacterized protein n=1 Tax=Campylobacter ureolyticus TaxID=827 RepID=A0A9Q4KMQ3_9BACT|nr:hypothetical protein [Campylobacter ureolyticus]MCZ6103355.1 hypothetical protein [Campylobacter ureolyticus]MCZ6134555.1 hypothetical protein [Campylobacter ureolyticus]MCZ6160917.1 hypothetical protein [Campylobacter ureolyticus]MDU4981207.1 hypothetical protein [Campylobacter ureolyticus]
MIFQTLQTNLVNLDEHLNLAKKLGYYNLDKFKKAVLKIIQAKSLDVFLQTGYYDYVYTSENLVLKLAKIYGFDILDELNQAKKLNDEVKKYKNSYIYIDTNFKRTTQPIFMLAMMQGVRYVYFDKKELVFKSLDKQLQFISKIVKNHYKKIKKLPLFGEITGYKFNHLGKNYSFGVDGTLQDREIYESIAWIEI